MPLVLLANQWENDTPIICESGKVEMGLNACMPYLMYDLLMPQCAADVISLVSQN